MQDNGLSHSFGTIFFENRPYICQVSKRLIFSIMLKKQILAIFFLAWMFVSMVVAQESRTELEARIGVGRVATFGNELLAGSRGALGGYLGADVRQRFGNTFSLHIGVLAERKGTATAVTFTDANGAPLSQSIMAEKLDYVSVPLFTEASLGKNDKIYVEAGGYASYLLRARSKISNPLSVSDVADNYTKMDFGCGAGAGICLPLSNASLRLGLRYTMGLANVSKLPVWGNGSIQNSSLCVTGSYMFWKN